MNSLLILTLSLLSVSSSVSGNLSTADLENFLNKINKLRAETNALPVCYTQTLMNSAQEHSNYQSQTHDMTHSGAPGMENPEVRDQNAGFKVQTVGENVAWNQKSIDEVFKSWDESPGHHANMINPNYKFIGLAQTNYYWTTSFGGDSTHYSCMSLEDSASAPPPSQANDNTSSPDQMSGLLNSTVNGFNNISGNDTDSKKETEGSLVSEFEIIYPEPVLLFVTSILAFMF